MNKKAMSGWFDGREPMSPKELAAVLKQSLASRPSVDPWRPKVLGVAPDGGKIVSTLDWLRLRRDNTEGWEGEAAVTLANETYRMARTMADERQSGLRDHVANQKAKSKASYAAIVAHVRANPRGSLKRTIYIEDVATACGCKPRKVRYALSQAAIKF